MRVGERMMACIQVLWGGDGGDESGKGKGSEKEIHFWVSFWVFR
jgi:hypothetical protein